MVKKLNKILLITSIILLLGGLIALIVYFATRSSKHGPVHSPGPHPRSGPHPSPHPRSGPHPSPHPSPRPGPKSCCISQLDPDPNIPFDVHTCSCGQWGNYYLSKKYISPPDGTAPNSYCRKITSDQNQITANTQAYWSRHKQNPPMICNSIAKNSNCCWWGRGAIQTTGPHNYYMLNKDWNIVYPDNPIHLCKNPQLICPPVVSGTPYDDTMAWFSGIQFWATQVEKRNSQNYNTSLKKMVGNVKNWTHRNIRDASSFGELITNAIEDPTNFVHAVASAINLGVWKDTGADPLGAKQRISGAYFLIDYFYNNIQKKNKPNAFSVNNLESTLQLDSMSPDILRAVCVIGCNVGSIAPMSVDKLSPAGIPICKSKCTYNTPESTDCRNCPILINTLNFYKVWKAWNGQMNTFSLDSPLQTIVILAAFFSNVILETAYLTTCDESIWAKKDGTTPSSCYDPNANNMVPCPQWKHEMCYYPSNPDWFNKPRKEISPFMCTEKSDLPVCKKYF